MTPYEDVFISYSSEDRRDAIILKKELEKSGITCWMSDDSLLAGSDYAKEIPHAIRACRVFILLLSKNAQRSEWVPRELDQAINSGKLILPFMIENCSLDDQFRFYLSKIQIYYAWKNRQGAVDNLIYIIRNHLYNTPAPHDNPKPDHRRFNALAILIVVVIIAAAAVFSLLRLTGDAQKQADDSQNPAGDSQISADDSQNPAGDSQISADDSQNPAGDSQISISEQSTSEETPAPDSGTTVHFEDPVLRKAICNALNIQEGEITPFEAENQEKLDLSWKEGEEKITDLSGLSAFTHLKDLDLSSQGIVDITELQNLKDLTIVNLEQNHIEDISPLEDLTNLESIDLYKNMDISDISPLFALTKVKMLDLRFNHIKKLDGISGMVSLKKLYLSNNQISDISPVVGLRGLTYLSFNNNAVSDIRSLGVLANLHTLAFNGNNVKDISVLTELTNLKTLQLANNPIENPEILNILPDTVEIEKSDTYKNSEQ